MVFRVNSWRALVLTIIAKSSILDGWQNSEFASVVSNNLRKKVHLMFDKVLNSPS